MGCGLKEGEQGFTRPGTPNAIVALVCARGGNMPADCSQSPLIGRWAGKRVLGQGDYAEDDDLPNWDGPALSKLYTAMTPADERQPWDGMPEGYWDNVPVFADISDMARGFLEAACNIRYFDQTQKLYDGKGKIVDSWTRAPTSSGSSRRQDTSENAASPSTSSIRATAPPISPG